MGYTTKFKGAFTIDPPLTSAQINYLKAFSRTRRVRRDPSVAAKQPDPLRNDVGLPLGVDAEYFVGNPESMWQRERNDPSILDNNKPPALQPNLWCNWTPDDSGESFRWNGTEKFYDYADWVDYLILHFFQPFGRVLNGTVQWQGESIGDTGEIIVTQNTVKER